MKNKGFTLVELLVVLGIVGILATLLIVQLGVVRERAENGENTITKGDQIYQEDKNLKDITEMYDNHGKVYKFRDGNVNCYVARSDYNGAMGISCVNVSGR